MKPQTRGQRLREWRKRKEAEARGEVYVPRRKLVEAREKERAERIAAERKEWVENATLCFAYYPWSKPSGLAPANFEGGFEAWQRMSDENSARESRLANYRRANNYLVLAAYHDDPADPTFKGFRSFLSAVIKGTRTFDHTVGAVYPDEEDQFFDNVSTVLTPSYDYLHSDPEIRRQLLILMMAHGLTVIETETGTDMSTRLDPATQLLVDLHRNLFQELADAKQTKRIADDRATLKARTKALHRLPSYEEGLPEVLREIKSLRRKRKGIEKRRTCGEIADILNAKGIKTLQGKQFTAQIVANILHRSKEPKKVDRMSHAGTFLDGIRHSRR